jgi:NAD(P)-dependent dehydrogenase (short-subunit alcohol dehydrogenase family)
MRDRTCYRLRYSHFTTTADYTHQQEAGRKAVTAPGDIREESTCKSIIDKAVSELGGIDILVNNAAYQMVQEGGIEDLTTDQFDRVMKTNLYAMFWLSKFAVPHLKPGSSIINTTSIQVLQSSQRVPYVCVEALSMHMSATCNLTFDSWGQFTSLAECSAQLLCVLLISSDSKTLVSILL